MREWNHDLGIVDTIYEEEEEEEQEEVKKNETDFADSLSPSPTSLTATSSGARSSSQSFLSPPVTLLSTVEEWTKATGYKTDVVVHVQDRCFHLHRDPLISRSGYLRRHLTESSTITFPLNSNISADTFSDISVYCYSSVINLTPSNLAAIKTAAEWLEMNDDNDRRGSGNLTWLADDYFAHEIVMEIGNARHVLSTCVKLLPAAAGMAVRCIEVLAGGGDDGWMEELTALTVEDVCAVAESMRTWLAHDHDMLYRIVDHYLQNQKEKLTEEEKTRICSHIDCTNLSSSLLHHLIKNPRLPLRFVVQAMLLDQLYTRQSLLSAPTNTAVPTSLTLGTILQRDAVLRESSHLRASMQATVCRIDSLERDLSGLRQRLRWSEEKKAEIDSVRSSSFRVVSATRDVGESGTPRSGKGFGWRLMSGLKSVFKGSKDADIAETGKGTTQPSTVFHQTRFTRKCL